MPDDAPNTMEKALTINLDPLKYGTIVEIGAGQEVARWFFQAGAAAGTVAKTMSAYDMKFSDEIYGVAADRRYVSRSRLEQMLAQEYDLIISRIRDHRPPETTFFAFANTVTALGYRKRDECHGWMGVRLQTAPNAEPDDIVLHVRMLDDTNLEQQDALGILGVNLIYGAFLHADQPERLMRSLLDNLKWGRVEIDLVEFRGPRLGSVNNGLMALELVKASLTPAVLFNPDGDVTIPADVFYKHNVLGMRGEFNPITNVDIELYNYGKKRFFAQPEVKPEATLFLAEMTMAKPVNEGDADTAEMLSRIDLLSRLGFHVLISEFFRYFRVRQYIARYTSEPVAIVTDTDGFADIIREDYYDGLDGGILEGLGKLFPRGTTVYVCPTRTDGKAVTLDTMPIDDHLRPLIAFLQERGQVIAANDFDPGRIEEAPVVAPIEN